MIRKLHSLRSSLLAVLLCGVSAVSLFAQGPGGPPPGGGGQHHGPPPNVLFNALDTNHDGVISADEIANASTSLKALLKSGATELKREDLRPARPAAAPGGEAATDSAHPRMRTDDARTAQTAAPTDETTGSTNAKADAPAGGPGGHPHHGPPPNALFDALDTNHDGAISAEEMANASASLKALLKNGATDIKKEDLRPAHPPQGQGN